MEKLFTNREAARYLKVSVRTVTRMVSNLEVPVYKVGHQIRIPASSIKKMIGGPLTSDKIDGTINNMYEN